MVVDLEDFLPPKDCKLCSRLVEFREENQAKYPNFFNGAVPAFGDLNSKLLVVGLAPGLKGANQTGRPFTGDYAGDVLYQALLDLGLASGSYDKRIDDGLKLNAVRITNAVRCVPPQNKPTPDEVKICGKFLTQEIQAMHHLRAILCLGRVSHDATLRGLGLKLRDYPFAHGAQHGVLVAGREVMLFDSYHTSRYNIQTNRMTLEMFKNVVNNIQLKIDL